MDERSLSIVEEAEHWDVAESNSEEVMKQLLYLVLRELPKLEKKSNRMEGEKGDEGEEL